MADVAGTRPRARGGKEVVLDAAISNFTSVGFHGTSMRDIARDAGMTVASIYHHFPSKQEILQDIMTRSLVDVIAATRRAVLAESSPTAQLRALMTAWVLFHTNRQAEALIGASELRSLDKAGRRLVVALRDEQEQLFRDVIDRGVEGGEFHTPYPREATRAILNMGSSIAFWYRVGGDATPTEMGHRYADLALAVARADTVSAT